MLKKRLQTLADLQLWGGDKTIVTCLNEQKCKNKQQLRSDSVVTIFDKRNGVDK